MKQNDPIRVIIQKENPLVSVIIPSLDGYRGGNVPKLLDDLRQQTFQDFELLIVKGVSPCARAHNEGVKQAQGDIIVFFDDDITLGHNKVIENLVQPLLTDKTIGITGASQLIPPDANRFQRLCTNQFSRFQFPVVRQMIESDMATHAAMAIRRNVFRKVGGENENLIYGDDPDLRARVRKTGYKIVVVPDTWVYHPPPRNLSVYLRFAFQRGKGSAQDFCRYPNLIYETPPGLLTTFIPQRRFTYRVTRAFCQGLWSLVNLKFIFLFVRLSYGLGYAHGLLTEVLKLEKKDKSIKYQ